MMLAYIKQIKSTGLVMWLAQPNNWLDAATVVLQGLITACHVSGYGGAGGGICHITE